MTVEDLVHLELAYAPPFGSARDVVNIAGLAAQNLRRELLKGTAEIPKEYEMTRVNFRWSLS